MRDKLIRFVLWPVAVAATIIVCVVIVAVLVVMVPTWLTHPPR